MKAALLVVGLATAGLGFIWWRNRKSADDGSKDPCDAMCEAQASVTGVPADLCKKGLTYQACKAAKGALGAAADFLHTPWERYDAENKALNGAVDVPFDAALSLHTTTNIGGAGLPGPNGLRGSVVRFKNGCVPYEGAPGWESCAPGTHNMATHDGTLQTRKVGSPDSVVDVNLGRAFTQLEGDPFTQGPYQPGGQMKIKAGFITTKLAENFPLPLASGETGWYAGGKPFVCPAGTLPDWSTRDHREGADGVPACTPGGQSAWTSTGPAGMASNGVRTDLECGPDGRPPDGMTWDPSDGGFWRRLKGGETPNPGPCAVPIDAPHLTSAVLASAARRLAGSK